MSRVRTFGSEKRQIYIDQPEGNAFNLMGLARSWGEQLGHTPEHIKAVSEDMRSGDYNHLCEVFEREFGHLAELVRSDIDDEDY